MIRGLGSERERYIDTKRLSGERHMLVVGISIYDGACTDRVCKCGT